MICLWAIMRRNQAIRTWDLTKYYGKVVGIESMYADVLEGETFGLLGLSGSGKSTIIQLLMGLKKPTRGNAELLELNVRTQSYEIRKLAGCTLGNFAFYGDLTGGQFLSLCDRFKKKQGSRRHELVQRLEVDLGRKFKDYSLDDRQKLALIQALMHDPPLLLLDDPTTGLDPLSKEIFYHILTEEKSRGKTILLSTNSPTEVAKFCERVGIVKDGHLRHIQDMDDLKNDVGRRLRIVFREDVDLEDMITEDIFVVSHNGREWVLAVRGHMGSFVKRIGAFNIGDVFYVEGAAEEALTEMFREQLEPEQQ